jgi:ribosomal protein L24E
MTDTTTNAWLVIQAHDSDYADEEGRCYEYPSHISFSRGLAAGDVLVVCRPKRDAPGGRRVVGIGRIGSIHTTDEGRIEARYDRWLPIDPPATFDEIGGDPRANKTNSINSLSLGIVDTLIARAGLSGISQAPAVYHTRTPLPLASELRQRLFESAVADLLGPAAGKHEEIPEGSVRDRYLVGQLAPLGEDIDPGEIDEVDSGESSAEEGEAEAGSLPSRSLAPSSMGLTFCVDSETESLQVEASWGHYRRGASEVLVTETGQAKTVWIREPAGGSVALTLRSELFDGLLPDPQRPDVVLEGRIRRSDDGHWIVTLFLVNRQTKPDQNVDEAWLFQPELVIRGVDGASVFRRRRMTELGGGGEAGERAILEMLYRKRVEFAVGHGVSVHAAPLSAEPGRAAEVRTRVLPFEDIPVTEPPDADDPGLEGLADLVLDMRELAEMDRPALSGVLGVLATEYGKWIDRQNGRIRSGELSSHEEAAEIALHRCSEALRRLREGIAVLDEDDRALEAFRFANRAMAEQRIHSILSQERRRRHDVSLGQIDRPENRSWFPFQLAFLLLAIPSLADPSHRDRTAETESVADLLWFPTGGGKTEAYLGVAAFAMGIRRLQGTLEGLDGRHGVAVIMRYTLRLLTLQQFQRATALLCAMEVIRREEIDAGNDRWGTTPFRIGLWIGANSAPNRTEDAHDWVMNSRGNAAPSEAGSSPAQLTACPWCGSEIRPGRDIVVKKYPDEWRTYLFCSDKNGECPFSHRRSPREGLPVVVVDEEIYRLLPSMIVATVDKFAQMPWAGETQALFGRVSGVCPRHGFLTPSLEDEKRSGDSCRGQHPRRGSLPGTTRRDASRLRPPDLVIQDELHLISGPLGTMVGLYETAVDELCTWEYGGAKVRPKVVASTATVRKAPEQVHALFCRSLEIFPPPGLEVEDNFFSRQRPVTEEKPGRRYLGICAPGKSRPSVLLRVYVAFLCAAQKLYDDFGAAADPWMTAVGYFNSLRELGGMRRLVEDDVRTRAFRVDKSDIVRPGLARRDVSPGRIEELTSRRASSDIPKILDRLEERFEPARGTDDETKGLDVLLATNMVSVGVDVGRLGLMIVNGQPKTTAEYIQATSRVGRRWPGLVATVLNWARPRDLSHYESFEHYHATFYRFVEALSVTPFSPRAVDRGLTGVLASIVRLEETAYNENPGAGEVDDPGLPVVRRATDTAVTRAWWVDDRLETRNRVRDHSRDRFDEWAAAAQKEGRTLGYRSRRDGTTVGLLEPPGGGPWKVFTTPTSLREVEPSVNLLFRERGTEYMPPWKRSGSEPGKGSEE